MIERFFTLDHSSLPTLITFEGFYDTMAGWEFDMPLHVVKPIYLTHEVGSPYIEHVLEDFMIDLDVFGHVKEQKPINGFLWPYTVATARQHFYKARKNKARKGIEYWKAEVEVKGVKDRGDYTELDWEYKYISDNVK